MGELLSQTLRHNSDEPNGVNGQLDETICCVQAGSHRSRSWVHGSLGSQTLRKGNVTERLEQLPFAMNHYFLPCGCSGEFSRNQYHPEPVIHCLSNPKTQTDGPIYYFRGTVCLAEASPWL